MLLENKTTEFKRGYTDDIKYAVLAFANTEGGKIYIGINDDGSVCGVSDIDDTMLRVTNMIRDAIRPDVTMFIDCSTEDMENKPIVTITVQRGTARPYYLAGKGVRPEGIYVRQGASSVPASETAILDMIKETSGNCYEDSLSLNQQLTFHKASVYFAKKGIDFGEAQKRSLNIMGSNGIYTNLGMLLSDQCSHTIKLSVFEGSKKSVFHDRRELTGSLLGQLEEAYKYIDDFNRTRAEFHALERIDIRDYPPEALREALLNAIVHRDYSISGPTLISIFDDRIEFVTIGGLVRGISYDDIMLGISVLRNEHLANVFYRLRLIEAYGTGMMKINEAYSEEKVKPKVEVSNHAFKITLPNRNYSFDHVTEPEPEVYEASECSQKDKREEVILQLLNRQQHIARKDVEKALGVSQATAILILRRMTEQGMLIRESSGKNIKYSINHNDRR